MRHPALLAEIEWACSERQENRLRCAANDGLRLYFRKQMVRIQADSVYHAVPVFRTLQRTSDLADSIIAAAYDTALAERHCGFAAPRIPDMSRSIR